jgi:glycosyltransferase involved in cell wall biosynthesis
MLIDLDAERPLPGAHDGAAVLILIQPEDEPDAAIETLTSVTEHTPSWTPVLVVGLRSAVAALRAAAVDPRRDVHLLGCDDGAAGSAALGEAVNAVGGCDVALVRAGVRVTSGWLDGLASAARSDTAAATATPLSLGVGGIDLEWPDADESPLDALAETIRRISRLRRPRTASFGISCSYLTREALDAHGPVDGSLELDDALGNLARRISASGMLHVAADDVLVDARRAGLRARQAPDEAAALRATIESDDRSPLRHVLAASRRAARPLSVTIDARALVSRHGGTQTYLLGLIRALSEADRVVTRVLTPPDLSPQAQAALGPLDGVELVSYSEVVDGAPRTDVVHRPQQVFTVDDLNLLRLAGERLVIGQQDLISYHASTYHADLDSWRAYRRVTRMALAAADQVVFFSEHAREDALTEELIGSERTAVVGIGRSEDTGGPQQRPPRLEGEEPFLLCLGADYAHKNRPFAIELQGALQRRGWAGRLVLAGAHVEFGSSAERERELLDAAPSLRGRVVDLGPVSDAERRWLLARASALLYPTFYEGFGLMPAEAAAWNVPCLFAARTSLAELPHAAATLVPWDADASAAVAIGLLGAGDERSDHLRALKGVRQPAWSEVAEELTAVYGRAVSGTPRSGAWSVWQELERERVIGEMAGLAQEYQDAYHALQRRVEDGLPLIDEGGLLSRSQQRGLMRVASRRLGRAALAPLELLGRSSSPSVAEPGESHDE